MARFVKKPVVVEAEQFIKVKPLPFRGNGNPVCYGDPDGVGPRFYIETKEGFYTVSEGDWVIRGVKGEFYPCKPDIFELTYEEIVDLEVGL